MKEVHIRVARREDCPRILELIHELAVFEKAPDEVTVTLAEMEDCGFGDRAIWQSLVAEVDGKIEGIALHYDRYSTWKGRRLYLEDLIVTEKLRGSGIGKRLLDELMAYAKEQKYNGMVWQVLDWNQPAIDFYKKYNAKFEDEWVNVSVEF